ncbi:hypothetical protein [Halothermothrix orenii]|uniref:hypothetical protein n=1 Tax=Halothermothrix orenii TaxID=31909 RepID=UPI0002F57619|nr:hypothetical protein [Halothermothrix orenii]
MKFLKKYRKSEKSKKSNEKFLRSWEFNMVLTLIILMVMATIVDLGISFDQVFKFILH